MNCIDAKQAGVLREFLSNPGRCWHPVDVGPITQSLLARGCVVQELFFCEPFNQTSHIRLTPLGHIALACFNMNVSWLESPR